MPKKTLKNLLLILAGAVIGAAIVLALPGKYRAGFSAQAAYVEVINKSNFGIAGLKILHKFGAVTHGRIETGRRVTIPIYAGGEGSYKIEVTLDNGALLKGGLGYVEAGYATEEIVINSGITSIYKAIR
ncbi:MAG: hypothetical protein A2637_00890 [Candidatus Muproteobacteria bacterium RIFCSPHIGHO2_01_FULL_65_16]|uniref:Uncharacterized protein n=1 Tax=Candidatus Muproteobacteria bacterium RIFCSPHIGHO2_01_FULL_65_16 TaxID=1817764 RepID=A0A1F6TIW1_9PROT|nr:MAG: hypothetical protein A2637_00890 [Candidatus Muproteobacteria bacterium RIFCSPHIGHO2_01_FULL_65_16]